MLEDRTRYLHSVWLQQSIWGLGEGRFTLEQSEQLQSMTDISLNGLVFTTHFTALQ